MATKDSNYTGSYPPRPASPKSSNIPVGPDGRTAFPFVDYNKMRRWAWVVAVIEIVIGVFFFSEVAMAQKETPRASEKDGEENLEDPAVTKPKKVHKILMWMFASTMLVIQCFAGMYLMLGMSKTTDIKFTLRHCQRWVYVAYITNSVAFVLFLTMLSTTLTKGMDPLIMFLVIFRLSAFISVRKFMCDMRKFLEEKDFVRKVEEHVMFASGGFDHPNSPLLFEGYRQSQVEGREAYFQPPSPYLYAMDNTRLLPTQPVML